MMRRGIGIGIVAALSLVGCQKSPAERTAAATKALQTAKTAFDSGDYAAAQSAYAEALSLAPSDSAADGYIIANLATLRSKPVIEAYNRWEGAHYYHPDALDSAAAAAPSLLAAPTDSADLSGGPEKISIEGFHAYSTTEPNGISPIKFDLISAQRRADSAGYNRVRAAAAEAANGTR